MGAVLDELITRGHHKGSFENPRSGAVCILGAGAYAAGAEYPLMLNRDGCTSQVMRVWDAIEKAFYTLHPEAACTVDVWQDAASTSLEDVKLVAKYADQILEDTK